MTKLDYETQRPRGSLVGWLLAYVLFPYGPFVYLAVLRAISLATMAVFVLLAAVIHVGGFACLASTNAKPWQPWLGLAYLAGFGLIAAIQFVAGYREHLWSRAGRLVWLVAGAVFVAALLGFGAVLLYSGVGF